MKKLFGLENSGGTSKKGTFMRFPAFENEKGSDRLSGRAILVQKCFKKFRDKSLHVVLTA